ncbi:LlaJI family restriction endonuclease [uncultured Bacteroides sp.]|uniref:LlaJI family restriction endonuclease n=1 Tax=uncultured Bacteroides sp. TaxID=162156 RepID=UPI00267076DD|nr:LlaJI family restriction endonuclease [uncultured Bacteroides sp.]
MKLLIEEYQYNVADVADVLDGLFTLQDVEQRVSVSYVGYYYNPHERVKDVVFILPKVLIDEQGKVFGEYEPQNLIHLDEAKIDDRHRKFLYEFAVWIHRAIVVYNDSHDKNEIVLHRQIQDEGKGSHKKKSNTLLDVILSLIRFNKENQQFFTFILKNLHSGFNKINWSKTIARTTAIVQDSSPTYLNPVNKKRQVNFDEELIVIFFSILQYISDTYGFRSNINFGFKLITGARFKRYLDGFGRTRLRQIKYKYFSDTAVKLWDLCYAFFDKTYKIRVNTSQSEYLLVKSFHIVFEAMIDELIGDTNIPHGLKEQDDGKLVDHFYTYDGLLIDDKADDDIYYIGDSKYYKIGNSLGKESIYKQRTYARNVIQWNLDIWLNGNPNMADPFERIQLFDEVTEGYNVIPNFFISASIDKKTLSYEDYTEPHPNQPPVSRQFKNRLYDRDTLLLSYYDVNFLFVLALYARNNAGAKAAWRHSVRDKFRRAVQDMLKEKFDFYALAAHPDVDASTYFKAHFQETLGKTFRPYANQQLLSLALDKEFSTDNDRLLATLGENFYVVPVDLGEDPTTRLETEREVKGTIESSSGMGKFLTCLVRKEETGEDGRKNIAKLYQLFYNHEAEGATYVMLNMPGGDISEAKFLLPLIDNTIDGFYDIERISFGTRTKVTNDGQSIPNYPTLRIKIGAYHSLDRHCTEGIVPRMANQIWSYTQLQNVIAKSQSYFYEKNDEKNDEKLIAQEPEVQYAYHQVENDYIDESFDLVNKNSKNAE